MPSNILRKIKSLSSLLKKKKTTQPPPEIPIPRDLEREKIRIMLIRLADEFLITNDLHEDEREDKRGMVLGRHWANNIN